MQKLLYSSWQASKKACHPVRHHTGRRTNRGLVRPPILWTSLFAVLLSCSSLTMALDSDQDGLSDAVEKRLGYDPRFFDSNVDGISDFSDARKRKLVNAKGKILKGKGKAFKVQESREQNSFSVAATSNKTRDGDADKDGVDDVLESYGYYWLGSRFSGVKRKITQVEWNSFKNTSHPIRGSRVANPFKLAAKVIEKNAWIDKKKSPYELSFVGSREALLEVFLKTYTKNHAFYKANSTLTGSLSNILATLSKFPISAPKRGRKTIPYYFTDSSKYSSDFDPFSDKVEASKLNISPSLQKPADHPLVSAYPVIEANLKSYTVTSVGLVNELSGTSISKSWSKNTTRSHSTTHGWDTRVDIEASFNPLTLVSAKGSAGYNGSVTNATSDSVGVSNVNAENFSTTKQSDPECVASLSLSYEFKNTGTAPAYDIKARVNIYIGNVLIGSYTTSEPIGDLSVNETIDRLVPEKLASKVSAEKVCLSLESLKLITAGGAITTEVVVKEAKVAFFDEEKSKLEKMGNWKHYISRAKTGSAKIQLKTITTNGVEIDESYLVYAGNSPQVTIGDALYMAMGKKNCPSHVRDQKSICLGRGSHETIILDNASTYVGIHSFDRKGVVLSHAATAKIMNSLIKEAGGSFLNVSLEAGWKYSFVTPESKKSKFNSHLLRREEVKGRAGYRINASVSDSFGIDKVWFCPAGGNSQCKQMTRVLGKGERATGKVPTLARYSLRVSDSTPITRNSTLRVKNIIGITTSIDVDNVQLENNGITKEVKKYLDLLKRSIRNAKVYLDRGVIPKHFYDEARKRRLLDDMNWKLKKLEEAFAKYEALSKQCNVKKATLLTRADCIRARDALKGIKHVKPYYKVPMLAFPALQPMLMHVL